MLCDNEQIGSEWAQRMMMMPIANISSGSTPSTTATATAAAGAGGGGSSCSSSSAKLKGVMLHQNQHQHQQQDLQQHGAAAAAAALKCPRCDSSNTKFCYYNNYSLSQPRHFCKACKRYWTRGGTLRNVPVGGGCRKNKRVKKSSHQQQSSSTAAAATSTRSATVGAHPLQQPPQSSSMVSNLATSATNHDLSSFLYSDMNLAAFSTASTAAYDALGLGGPIPSNQLSAAGSINNNLADLQQQAASFLNNDYSTSFGSQAASLLVSSLKQPKTAEEYQSLLPYDSSANLGFLKDVKKAEGDKYNLMSSSNIRTEWQTSYQFESNGASDASYLYWNSSMGGAGGWPDVANPSVAPLI